MTQNGAVDRSSSSPSEPASSHRISSWSVFLDQYDATTDNIRRKFELLAAARDMASQQRLADDIEQELYDGKHQIDDISREAHNFPYHMRSKAAAQIQQCKQQLEQHYATLVLYQQRHKQGQIVTPQLLLRDQQAAAAAEAQHSNGAAVNGSANSMSHSSSDQSIGSPALDDDNIDDTTSLLLANTRSSSSASPSPTSASTHNTSRSARLPMSAQRASLISTAGHHVDFNDAASRTHSSLIQSADIGQETGRLLAQQRESLHRQQMSLHDSDAMSSESSRSMDRIRCRRISDNLIAWLIVIMQIGLFCLIARVKYFT